jgi:Predicted acetyltransferase
MIKIRKVASGDIKEVYDLVKTAFETAEVKSGDEQDYQETLRNGDKYIPSLDLVAEDGIELVGQIILTKFELMTADGVQMQLLLGPLSVRLDYRCRGIGGQLIDTACEEAERLGYKAVFLAGNPDYYGRYGFEQSVNFGIKNINGYDDKYILCRELTSGALDGVTGTINMSDEA